MRTLTVSLSHSVTHMWACHDRNTDWLLKGEIQKLVVVITGADSKDVLERWVFNVETDKSVRADG